MKTIFSSGRIALFSILLLLAGFGGLYAQEKTVRVAAGEWPPFISQDIPGYGFVAKIVEEAFAKSGYKVVWGFFPWKRSYDLAASGEWDATVPWMPSAERLQTFLASDALFISTEGLVFKKPRLLQWKDFTDLANLKIGAALGYFYGEAFDSAEKAGTLRIERSDDETNLKKLIAGRLDVVAINPVVAWDLLKKLSVVRPGEMFAFADRPLKAAGSSFLVSKLGPRHDEIFAAFDRGLSELRKSGVLKAYYDAMLER